MAHNDHPLEALKEKDGQKLYLTKLTIGTSPAMVDIPATAAGDWAIAVPQGAMLCLQSDVAFWYRLRTQATSGGTPATTNYSGSAPGTYVAANQQEFVQVRLGVVSVDAVAASSGTLCLHLVRSS